MKGRITPDFGVECAACLASVSGLGGDLFAAVRKLKAMGWRTLEKAWRCKSCDRAKRPAYVVTGEGIGRRAARKAKRAALNPSTSNVLDPAKEVQKGF